MQRIHSEKGNAKIPTATSCVPPTKRHLRDTEAASLIFSAMTGASFVNSSCRLLTKELASLSSRRHQATGSTALNLKIHFCFKVQKLLFLIGFHQSIKLLFLESKAIQLASYSFSCSAYGMPCSASLINLIHTSLKSLQRHILFIFLLLDHL